MPELFTPAQKSSLPVMSNRQAKDRCHIYCEVPKCVGINSKLWDSSATTTDKNNKRPNKGERDRAENGGTENRAEHGPKNERQKTEQQDHFILPQVI